MGAGLGVMGALASVSLLAQYRLVYHCYVGRDAEDGIVQLHLIYFLPRQIEYCRLHYRLPLNSEFLMLNFELS
jgi:hypothetical protein